MINIFLKYKVFDWCIETMFEKINTNFDNPPLIKVGKKFSHIIIKRKDINNNFVTVDYTECTIRYVYKCEYFDKPASVINFTTQSGDSVICYDTESIRIIL